MHEEFITYLITYAYLTKFSKFTITTGTRTVVQHIPEVPTTAVLLLP
eukprot:SAG11_NODE_13138_length_668_cov_1.149385_2_plen_46_part_01